MNQSIVRWLIYPRPWVNVPFPPPNPLKEVTFILSNNARIFAWLYFNGETKPTLLYFHGNGENLATMWQAGLFKQLQELDVNFLVIDYPGYGRSTGKPSELLVMESAQVAFDWLEENYPQTPRILAGWSLGAAVAIHTVAKNADRVSGLIALSAWTSLPDVAREHYPNWIVNLFLKEKYSSLQMVKKINCPALFIHGARDRIIPISQVKHLSENYSKLSRFIEIPFADHNSLMAYPKVWEEMKKFLEKIL